MDFAPWFWTAKATASLCTRNEFDAHRTDSESATTSKWLHSHICTRGGGERIGHALSRKTCGVAHGAARDPGSVRLDFAGSRRVDGEEARIAADQCFRTADVLSDAARAADGQISDQGLPHIELCARRRV